MGWIAASCGLFCVAMHAYLAQADANRERLATALAHLQAFELNLKSVSIVYRVEQTAAQGTGKARKVRATTQVFRYQASGRKWRLEELDPEKGNSDAALMLLNVYDGEKEYQYTPASKTGGISSARVFPATYFDHVHRSSEGLAKLLEANAKDISAESVTADGEELLSLSWVTQDSGARTERELLLNKAAGYQPRRIRVRTLYPQDEANKVGLQGKVGQPQVPQYTSVRGTFFPSNVSTSLDNIKKDGTLERVLDFKLDLREVQPNANIPSKAFEVRFPDGTTVLDNDTGLARVIGSTRKWRPAPAREDAENGGLAEPRETQTRWGLRLAFLALNLILAVIGVAALVRWYKRRAKKPAPDA